METIFLGRPPWQQRLYAHMLGQAPNSLGSRIALAPLWLAAQAYRMLANGHRAIYACQIRGQHRLPCHVISIGNLTLGGTGKTPLTIWLARWYQQRGWRVAVLSRGYGVPQHRAGRVVVAGAASASDWHTTGDEPALLARALPGIPVLIGNDRYRSGLYACQQFGSQVVILDDGFQHHALWRDVDIVLIDASNPFGHGGLVPRGILREPLSGLRRADIIVLSRAEMARDTLPELSRQLRRWHACQPLYGMRTVVKALCHHPSGATLDLTWLQRRHVLAFAGLGNPQAFASTLRDQGAEVVVLLVFPDHHPYSARDWHTIVSWARQYQVAGLVTTEKDAVRLAPSWQAPIPLYTLRIGVAFRPGQEALQQHLQALEGSTATPGSGGGVS